jgi:hypothetical protein
MDTVHPINHPNLIKRSLKVPIPSTCHIPANEDKFYYVFNEISLRTLRFTNYSENL